MTQVAFSLIGPLDVRCSGPRSVVPAARQRSLLAALLVRANQPVSKQSLCLAVWGERLSDRAEVTLRSYVMRLRRVLGPSVSDRLSAQPSGYLLRLEEGDELDLLRLRACVRQGKRAAGDEDWSRSLRDFGEGLALWRGEPLCDVPSDSVRRTVLPTLAELRTQLWEGLYAAASHLSRVGELVVPLQHVVAEEPTSERLCMLLMSALAQCNRRVDALAEFRRLRQALISEQGVEPCALVQELHRQLLRDQSHPVRASRVTRGGPPVPVPRQLPRQAAAFTGRAGELSELAGPLSRELSGQAAAPVVAISGTAGIGKSALAIALAHRVAAQYPDGQLYADLETVPVGAVVARFLRALGVDQIAPARDCPGRIAQYRTAVAGRRMLIVLDGATGAEQVRPLIPGEESCGTLITSWWSMSQLAEARCVPLGELPDGDASRMLAALLGQARTGAEPCATASIIAACAGLPLALRIAAARLTARPGWPLGYMADLLADERSRLDELSYGPLSVRASLAGAYRALAGLPGLHAPRSARPAPASAPLTAATAFRRLGGWRAEFTATEATAHLSRPRAEVIAAVEALVDANLVAAPGPGRYRMNSLVRIFAFSLTAGD